MNPEEQGAIERARNILVARRQSGAKIAASAAELFDLGRKLAKFYRFDYARRMAGFALEVEPTYETTTVLQRQALWTSKNPDQPSDSKHDDALALLERIEPGLDETTDPETLGIAGGIWKRRWMIDGRLQSLEKSLVYYERGAALGVAKDFGYTAINAAFVQDLLASLEESPSEKRTELAKAHRQRVLEELPALIKADPQLADTRWIHETLAEAAFGLRDFATAEQHLRKVDWADTDVVKPWEFETTVRQFAWLAYLLDPAAKTAEQRKTSEPWQALGRSFGKDMTAGLATMFAGKFGLAMSGGGFRASFFHIGVLMYLAERDMLRHVEALSCVSGGSILGAHYYLLVRQLLQSTPQSELTREHYIDIVDKLAEQFLRGVQKNIRTRVILNPLATLKMILVPGYTRTTRLGELYETHLYSRVKDDGERRMRKLLVTPADAPNFRIHDNWRRSHKVPVLILNATSINTGHNWQFTASSMGEPPSRIDSRIDTNYRLRRLNYSQAPKHLQDIRIGQAAAASSCVPGLFSPIELQRLFPDVTVRLVDGGVHDNQGVFGLFDQDCSAMLVSDASGQMEADDKPKDGSIGVLLRSSTISMARVRTAQYRELASRKESGRLKEFMFLHLKQGLDAGDKDWIGCDTPNEDPNAEKDNTTDYDIFTQHQRNIANIRTDLDSFTDCEAYALIASGYKMTAQGFDKSLVGFETVSQPHTWKFVQDIEDELRAQNEQLDEKLRIGKQGAFKVWRQDKRLKVTAIVLGFLVVATLLVFAWSWRDRGKFPISTVPGLISAFVLWAFSLVVVSALGVGAFMKALDYRKTLNQIVTGIVLSVVGWVVAGVHLLAFDRLFLKLGKRPPRIGPVVEPNRLKQPDTTNKKTG